MHQRLKHARKACGLTQSEVGTAIHRSKTVIWELEAGKREPKDDELTLLSSVYSVPESWLKDGADGHVVDETVTADGQAWSFDSALHQKILATRTLDELRQLLPRATAGFNTTVAMPASSHRELIPWHEAQARQQAVDRHVSRLLENASPSREGDADVVLFNHQLEGAVKRAAEAKDKRLAKDCLNYSPYFVDLLVMAKSADLEELPLEEATQRAFTALRAFEDNFPSLVSWWRHRHDPLS
ncbi:MAG: helix-turn-helix transcriptional regulator [Planctomycetota bacterium]